MRLSVTLNWHQAVLKTVKATGYASQHIWRLSQARINWRVAAGRASGVKTGDEGGGSLISPDGVAPSRTLGVSASEALISTPAPMLMCFFIVRLQYMRSTISVHYYVDIGTLQENVCLFYVEGLQMLNARLVCYVKLLMCNWTFFITTSNIDHRWRIRERINVKKYVTSDISWKGAVHLPHHSAHWEC